MELKTFYTRNYFPYAKTSILMRAIPGIDGLKPVQRRIMFAMHSMGLGKKDCKRAKSVKIIGETMGKYHPHGDSSIYEAEVLMSTGYEKLNVPYIDSKGAFGKVYSRDLQYAASRYTEAKLAPIANEFFDGIKEDAVDFKDNFDGSEKEPVLLPVKFPSLLVNSNAGIAVGTSSDIPAFSLVNVCKATQGVIDGSITNAAELAKVLGAPEFTTGGFLHCSEKSLEKLCATGKGRFVLSGRVQVYSNQIIIDQIPYNTTAEDIMDTIVEKMKDGHFKGIRDVRDEIGLAGLRIAIDIKGGYSSREVLAELNRLTSLRNPISFRTRVIVDGRCLELSLLEVLNYWLSFRVNTIRRITKHRLDKEEDREHILSTWEKIIDDIVAVVKMISENTDENAKALLNSKYGLSEIQSEYLMNLKIRSITTDRANKSLKELKESRDKIAYYKEVIENDSKIKDIIKEELDGIISNYGTDNNTTAVAELTEDDNKAPEVKISDEKVVVVLTKGGYLKRLQLTINNTGKYVSPEGDEEAARWVIQNNQHILVFDRFGYVHKLLVDDIDSSRGKLVDKAHSKAGLENPDDIIWIDACGDYSKYFNLIYMNGKGCRVYYDEARPEGTRKSYRASYSEVPPKQYFTTTANKFFLVTHKNKAAYANLENLGVYSNRNSFKVAKASNGDVFVRLITEKQVPNLSLINIAKYHKSYTVSIGEDMLWNDPKRKEEADRILQEKLDSFKKSSDVTENNTSNEE